MWVVRKKRYAFNEAHLYRVKAQGRRWWSLDRPAPRGARRMPFRFECTFQTLEECIVLMTTIERMLNLSTQPVRYYEWQLTKTGEQAFSRVINDQWQRLYRQQNDRNLFECRHPQYMEWAEKAFPGSVEPSKASKRVLDLQQD